MQLINVIGVLCVFVLLLLASFLLSVNTHNKLANRLFALFLTLTALNLSGWFIWLLLPGTYALELFRMSFSFLEMPVFYLYVLAICYKNFRLKLSHLLHGIPFLVVNFLAVFELSQPGWLSLASSMQWLGYILLVAFTLRRFKRIYRQNYTEHSNQSYRWLGQLTVVFVIAGSLATVKEVISFTAYNQLFQGLQLAVGVSALSVITWFVLKALSSPELFRGIDGELQLVETLVKQQKGTIASKLKTPIDDDSPETKRVKEYMQKEAPYLDPSLTLQTLAAQMQVPSKELSILINHKMGQHFFDFINRYRIEAAAKLLQDSTKQKLTVLEILYQVGFNSKSSFNTAFKNHTGFTPTQYRKNHLSKKTIKTM